MREHPGFCFTPPEIGTISGSPQAIIDGVAGIACGNCHFACGKMTGRLIAAPTLKDDGAVR